MSTATAITAAKPDDHTGESGVASAAFTAGDVNGIAEQPCDAADALADLCKAGADPLRLRVLRLLRHEALGVSELCELLDVRQPALSHHLKLMSQCGLLDSQRDGNHIFYRRHDLLGDSSLAQLQRALFVAADTLMLEPALESRRETLQHRREQNSRDFFRHNAERFRQQQDLIAAPERYAEAVTATIDALEGAPTQLALEVGPGDGWLLPALAERYTNVVALDNAAEMLAQSQQRAEAAGIDNVDFIEGDTGSEALAGIRADLVVINMVLHHTPEPSRTLAEAAATLKPGGVLLITELCEHGQGWARESCGDLWLGFAPQQLQTWAAAAGLSESAAHYLAQRNGFTLQVRLFQAPTVKTS
jgi:ubiquinone/menaquinone biosynthesis C-methylase UbiE/DNA-binding transcriptional ArsR family regulator